MSDTPMPSDLTPKYVVGNVLDVLKGIPDESIQCIVTSPPYWGLRDYGIPPVIWGGDDDCEHDWETLKPIRNSWGNPETLIETKQYTNRGSEHNINAIEQKSGVCSKCGAWRGQLGLEPTPELYVEHLVMIFRECRRVLRKDGTLWLNLGDSYCANRTYQVSDQKITNRDCIVGLPSRVPLGMKPKDLVGIPWMVAFALRADGWYLRSDIIWSKPNPMPESVKDRPTKSHEYIFLLTKSRKYYYDAEAIKEPMLESSNQRYNYDFGGEKNIKLKQGDKPTAIVSKRSSTNGRNKRTVWTITTKPYPEAHFAVFPPELPEICIKAGTPGEVCAICGEPRGMIYEHIEKSGIEREASGKYKNSKNHSAGSRKVYKTTMRKYVLPKQMKVAFAGWLKEGISMTDALDDAFGKDKWLHWIRTDTSGQSLPSPEDYSLLKKILELPDTWDKWMLDTVTTIVDDKGESIKPYQASDFCSCGSSKWAVPIVLDPFAGSGTTLEVARSLGRRSIGIDINPEYKKLASKRKTLSTLDICNMGE